MNIDMHDIPLHKWERIQAELDRTRKELEEVHHTIALFRANNRYQKGYGDGYAFAVDDMRKKITKLPPRG